MEVFKYTPDNIGPFDLKENEIFVFGSNEPGHHGAGAAKFAHKFYGAVKGIGNGLTGRSYALPTCTQKGRKYPPLSLDKIKLYVREFIKFAEENKHLTFYVTKIGCGYGNYSINDIKLLFKDIINIDNIILPKEFHY